MDFRERARSAAKNVSGIIQSAPSDELEQQVAAVIERAMIDAVLEDGERCVKAAVNCCSADKDLAHKITDEIRRSNTALIANLSSLR
ncbi:MAG: hypothetical protein ACE5H7_12700 [Acidiferrobacterales bacterium]